MNDDIYAEMSKGLPAATVNKNLEELNKELYALRAKYHIQDILCVMRVAVAYESGVGTALWQFHAGAESEMEAMCAFELGRIAAQRREFINKLIAGEVKP